MNLSTFLVLRSPVLNFLNLLSSRALLSYKQLLCFLFIEVGTSSKNIGIMFLVEVALGKEHEITKDNSSLKSAPSGFHSVVARGRTEPGQLVCFYRIILHHAFVFTSGNLFLIF